MRYLNVLCHHCDSPDTERVWPTFAKPGDWVRYVCHECLERFSARVPKDDDDAEEAA